MKALNKKFLVLAAGTLLSLTSCGGTIKNGQRHENGPIFDSALGKYQELHDAAAKIADDSDRYVKYAEAEAELLDSAVIAPYSTQGGAYAITRVAPRTIPYVLYGNDEDRLKSMVAMKDANKFIKSEERAEMLALWTAAREGGAAYDPAAYLTSKGYTLADSYTTTFSTAPVTLDILNTSEQSDTEVLVNMEESLVEYDNLGVLRGRLAKSVDGYSNDFYNVSEDGKTYEFTIRDDAKWYTNTGAEYGAVTAQDFVDGFHHMLDAQAGLEWLFDGVIEGVHEYLYEGGSFDNVGYKADGQKLTIKLCQKENFFITRLVYSCSSPINGTFFKSKGGAFGIEEFAAAKAKPEYVYGLVGGNNLGNMLYNSAYHPTQWDVSETTGTIKLEKTEGYYDADKVTMKSLTWVYNNGENMEQLYKDVKAGTYAGLSLSASTGTLKWAKDDGYFDTCKYLTDTTATSYLMALNLNRGTWSLDNGGCASKQTEADATAIWKAMQNKNFRKALLHGIDRAALNAITRGEDLASTNIRNIYTAPEFVSLTKEEKIGNKVFPVGTPYGTLVQYFLDQKGAKIKTADGQDGWFNPTAAVNYLKAAKQELGADWPKDGVKLDIVTYTGAASYVARDNGFKELMENTLGAQGVHINIIEATTSNDYYAVGYRASKGSALGMDIFYGSGWGPDYADPSTYLDTMAEGGYMVKLTGIDL